MAQNRKQPAPPAISPEDLAFEAEILRRNPKRKPREIVRFDFPAEVGEARAVYLAEQRAKDELLAAQMADANMSEEERKLVSTALLAEQREAIRLSIVGLILADEATGEIVRMHVDQSQPLMLIDEWTSKAWAALRTFFHELNGLSKEELGNAVRAARKLGAASAPPAHPAPAATAQRSGG